MSIFILIIGVIVVVGLRLRNGESSEILCKYDTTTINGIFTLLIFFSHSTQYWPLSSSFFDRVYGCFQNIHNQWVVTTFLAFSGFGVMHKIATDKGQRYVLSYPYKRILKTFINFDIVVVMYLIVALIIGVHYDKFTILGSFIGITSVGNSNWYIFAILFLYIFSYVAAIIFENNHNKQIITVFILTIFYIAIMWSFGFEMRYYSTVMCYPLGAFLAIYKDRVLNTIKRYKILTLLLIFLVIGMTYKLRFNAIIMNVSSVGFVLAVVWFLLFFEIKSNILLFFGKHAFSIFILQRIPGLLLYNYFGESVNKYIIITIDLAITIVIALLYDKWIYKIDKSMIALFEGKNENEIKI